MQEEGGASAHTRKNWIAIGENISEQYARCTNAIIAGTRVVSYSDPSRLEF